MTVIRTLIVAAFAVALSAFGANAEPLECKPVETVKQELYAAGLEQGQIVVVDDIGITTGYLKVLGKPPPDSKPVGLFFVAHENSVQVGIIEEEGCIKYHAVIPLRVHIQAWAMANRSV